MKHASERYWVDKNNRHVWFRWTPTYIAECVRDFYEDQQRQEEAEMDVPRESEFGKALCDTLACTLRAIELSIMAIREELREMNERIEGLDRRLSELEFGPHSE